MSRRSFLKATALLGTGAIVGMPKPGVRAQSRTVEWPVRVIMAGYGPATTSFSRGLDFIGEQLTTRFGEDVQLKIIYNVSDVGYTPDDQNWLVDAGLITLGYRTMSTGIPELEVAALPFLFENTDEARTAMDGPLGEAAAARIEAETNYRILGYFENGFRHVSNNVLPVYTPADLAGLSIRMLGIQARTFELLGAETHTMSLADALPLLEDGTIDGQENPFENTVSYGPYLHQRYHTATFHSYLSRPIFVHRPTFDAWPSQLQDEMRAAVREAVLYQRGLHDRAEIESQAIIREAGGEIVELTAGQRAEFVAAVEPLYAEAASRYNAELLALVGL